MSGVLGGWLSGAQIIESRNCGDITIEPFATEAVNPNSYNYTLGCEMLRLTSEIVDLKAADEFERVSIAGDGGYLLLPGECYLAHTAEVFGSRMFASLVTGRSSVGRKFVTNHVTAGLVDVGFEGQITLEVTVQRPTRVYMGIPFGQIFWFSLFGQAVQYAGKYQSQRGPVPSRLAYEYDSERS